MPVFIFRSKRQLENGRIQKYNKINRAGGPPDFEG